MRGYFLDIFMSESEQEEVIVEAQVELGAGGL